MNRHTTLLALIALIFATLLAACGDDDTDEATTDATDTTAAPVSEDDDEDGAAGSGDAAGLGRCGFLAGFATAFEDYEDPTFGQGTIDFGAMYAPLADAAGDVAESAPAEIRDAFRTVAEGFRAAADALEGVQLDFSDPGAMDPEAMARLESLEGSFGDDFDAASDEISAWLDQNCADLADAFDLDLLGR